MLQRAASNAYSWWWVSHIRTKQSKWMEQNLQDMEEKVQNVIKLIEEDGDSFAKRAEMYYKKRPELINFVEESYKAYRALAERYDHISTELQNANNTIASVFPERVPFMDEDDEEATPRPPKKLPEGFKTNIPKPPLRDLKSVVKAATAATKKFNSKKTATANTATANSKVPKSGLSRKEALEEVDKLQKQILALQTVKEFVKSSYDNSIARYWETEEQIKELQERVSILQDELGEGVVIEDNEARRLMAEAALKSCEEKLSQLQEKQERSLDETKIESKRINDVKAMLGSLMDEFEFDQSDSKEPRAKRDVKIVSETNDVENEMDRLTQHRKDLQLLQENIKEKFEAGSNSSLAAAEMAEKIDELVNKVISLENAVSSQTALVDRLKTETDELQDHIRTLEGDKESLIQDKNKLNDKLREMEQKLFAVQDLNQIVEDQNSNLQIHFTESRCNLNHLSEEVQNVLQGEEVLIEDSSHMQKNSSDQAESKYETEGPVPLNPDSVLPNDVKSAKEDNGLLVDVVNSDKEIKISSSVEDNVTSDNKFEVVGSTQNGVHTDNELKINGTLEMKEATSMENKPPKELKEQEKTLNPGNGDGKDTAVVNKITTTENQEVSQHPKSNEADHTSTESFQNTLRDDLKLEVAGSTQNGVHTDNELKTNDTLEMKEATPMESKAPNELKIQEKTLNPGNSDGKATVGVNTIITTENREVSQHPKSNEADHKSPEGFENTLDSKEHATAQDEPDWREMFMNGMQDREKALLTEYTNTLRNYKELKKKLAEIEAKNQDNPFDPSLHLQLNELKTSNALKDEEIRLLHQKLGLLQITLEGNEDFADSTSALPQEERDIEKLLKIELPASTSAIEEKFRSNIDVILEENLTFWLTFSTTYAEIQRFETAIKDLQAEVSKLEGKGKSSEASGSIGHSLKSDARPIYKHLTEIEAEITVWLEKSSLLKEELERRFSSLCAIQEEITNALKASAEDDDFRFTSYQAAKFQGEVLNMKQENNRVADELQAGLDIVTSLQVEAEKALVKLNEQFGLSTSKRLENGQLRQSETRARVPLRSFIFGAKPKKQSIFSCMTPGMHRKFKSNKE